MFASRHYHIHTDLPREQVVPLGRHMDAVFDQYQRRFAGFAVQNDQPMPLYLFATRAQYLAFMARHNIQADHSGGMFFVTPTASGLATWVQGHSRSQTRQTLRHEGFHQFAWRHLGPTLPVWANEGLAQYFGDALVIDQRMIVGLTNAQRIGRVKTALATGDAMSLDALLTQTTQAWSHTLEHNAPHAQLLYAQAWSLTYYLIHGDQGRHQPAFGRYLKALSQGDSHPHAWHLAFGKVDPARLEANWIAFATDQQPDPLHTATDRMAFLGTALRFMNQHDEPIPTNLDALRQHLIKRGFAVTRQSPTWTTRLEASDPSLYHYPRANGSIGDFKLLEPSRNDLPPRITAPGLRPEPTLIWTRSATGELIQEIQYH